MRVSKRSVIVFSSVAILGLSSIYFYKTLNNHEKEYTEEGGENFHDNNLNKIVVIPSETETPFSSIDYRLIDSLTRKAPKDKLKTIDDLATYLNGFSKTDLEKTRSIYIWLTHNINYDDVGYNNNLLKRDYSAKSVFYNKIAVCEGFSNLFLELGTKMNLEIQKITGYSKGYSYKIGKIFSQSDHAWNIIKINNEWRVFDATWGEGYCETKNNKLVSTKKYNENWFNVNPYVSVYTHFPENIALLNCKPVITLKQYEVFPEIDLAYFNFGFDPISTYTNVCNNQIVEFPECYNTKTKIKLINAPKFKKIQLGKSIVFEIYAPNILNIAIIDEKNNWIYLKSNKDIFKINYIPKFTGKLSLAINYDTSNTLFDYFITYQVVK